ncbi:MAG TPA: LD-carboxypeptidase [Vicinamibacterales bacterium]|nr:LD-carboxypeptidase [Vicinamibacterales bacterium]
MSRRLPAALTPGDRIAVVSPGSAFAREEFDAGVAELKRLGFVPVYDETVFAREAGYLAGTPELRAGAFLRFWRDPGIRALIATRGGYGSVQLLPLLDRTTMTATPKLFIGYSDNTSILSWLTCQCGLTALHGPMLDRRLSRGAAGYDESSFMALTQGGAGLTLAPDGLLVFQDGEAAGPLLGGTLTQLAASLGTPYAFDPPQGSILFIEDVNERPYRIDRMLTQLQLGGVLARASGIVFGEMRSCDEESGKVTARGVIQRLMQRFPGPVVYGFPSGHTAGPCWTLPLGVQVRLTTRPHPSLLVEEAPVG